MDGGGEERFLFPTATTQAFFLGPLGDAFFLPGDVVEAFRFGGVATLRAGEEGLRPLGEEFLRFGGCAEYKGNSLLLGDKDAVLLGGAG